MDTHTNATNSLHIHEPLMIGRMILYQPKDRHNWGSRKETMRSRFEEWTRPDHEFKSNRDDDIVSSYLEASEHQRIPITIQPLCWILPEDYKSQGTQGQEMPEEKYSHGMQFHTNNDRFAPIIRSISCVQLWIKIKNLTSSLWSNHYFTFLIFYLTSHPWVKGSTLWLF